MGESARWVSTYSSGNVPKEHKVVLRDQERLCRKQQKWLSTLRSEGWTKVSQKKEGKWKGRRDEGEEENEKCRWTHHTFVIHPPVNGHWWMPLSLFGYYAWCHQEHSCASFYVGLCLQTSEYIPRSGIAGSYCTTVDHPLSFPKSQTTESHKSLYLTFPK